MMNRRTYTLPLARWRTQGTYPVIVEEMKNAGFVFESENGKFPLNLQQPFEMIPPSDPRGGFIQYVQWDQETTE